MLSHRNGHKFSGPLMIIFLMDVAEDGATFKASDFSLSTAFHATFPQFRIRNMMREISFYSIVVFGPALFAFCFNLPQCFIARRKFAIRVGSFMTPGNCEYSAEISNLCK